MKMVSMKCDDAKEEMSEPAQQVYPYGLTINLDQESFEKLGIKELPSVGSKMTIECMVEVCSVSQYESKESENKSLSLQITDMAVAGKKSNPADKLYGKA